MRILVTNDDGIEAPGIEHLASAMVGLGDVVVVAPDKEFSGASAAIGAIWEQHPVVTRRTFPVDGVCEAWAIDGPPALAVMYARLGAFGDPFDLVVSGINPGANVGRSVYHSGTIGACLSGRNGGWSGVAVSQAASGWGVEGQAWSEVVRQQRWTTAAVVARTFVEALIADMPLEPVIANINVPNVEIGELMGWRRVEVGLLPPRAMTKVELIERPGSPGTYDVDMSSGDAIDLPEDTDGGAIERNYVAVTYLSRLTAEPRDDMAKPESSLTNLLTNLLGS
jgi:5'-nucleotidase